MSESTTYSIERLEPVVRETHRYTLGTTDLATIDAWVPLGTVECDWMGDAVKQFLNGQGTPKAGRYRSVEYRGSYATVHESEVTLVTDVKVASVEPTEAF